MPQEANIGERSPFLREERQVRRSLETYLSEHIHTDVGSIAQQQALKWSSFAQVYEPDFVPTVDVTGPVGRHVLSQSRTDIELISGDLGRELLAVGQLFEVGHYRTPPLFGVWLQSRAGILDNLLPGFWGEPVPSEKPPSLTGRPTGPLQFFENLLESWGLDEEAGAKLLGFERTIELSDLLRGTVSLRGRDTKDRLRHLLEIGLALDSLFRNEDSVRMWLREPLGELDGESPLDHLLEGSMEHLLRLRQLVEFLSGR